jgi:predicted transcriptional regulator YdeE
MVGLLEGSVLAMFVIGNAAGGSLQTRITKQAEFSVIGIEARTNNAREMGKDGMIARQWEKLFGENLLEKIPGRTDDAIIALYTDYASDRNGDYTYVLGARVKDGSVVPPGFVLKKVSKGRYAVLTTERGVVGTVVPEVWKKVWKLEDLSRLGGGRSYKSDFEVYDERARDPQNSQVAVYVGLK